MPLLYANMAGMAAGGVWIGLAAQWHVIWVGVVMVFVAPFILPVLIIPAGVFSHYMVFFHNTGKRVHERVMYACSIGYVVLFASLFSTAVFSAVARSVAPAAQGAGILWGAVSALLPLLLWASRDVSNVFVSTVVVAAQVALFFLVAAWLYAGALPFWMAAALSCSVTALITVIRIKKESR